VVAMNAYGAEELWRQVWAQKSVHIAAFSLFLLVIILVMIFRDRIAKNKGFLNAVRYGVLGISCIYVGIFLKAQPTTANIVIMANALKEGQFPLQMFVLEPIIFLSFVFIFITIFVWGRGVFCGWLCPYGAMLELLNKLYDKVLPEFRVRAPEKVHGKLIYLKYVFFIIILGISFYDFLLAEYLTEIEPFRTFVLRLNREWYFVLYFGILTAGSVAIYRAFCRYLCPLGGALAIPSLWKRIPLVKLSRYDFCSSCKICARTCKPNAIISNGAINSGECLDCLDCQVNYWDEGVCPVLIRRRKEMQKS
jgi:NosR/NirI family nitrous oxide reductase transcriptional regulator